MYFIYLLIFFSCGPFPPSFIICGCAGSSLRHGLFSNCRGPGLLSRCGVQASPRNGFSCFGARALGCMGFSSCSSRALGLQLNSCSVPARLLQGMWDPPRLGIKLTSPALAGGFFTTGPPGKSQEFHFYLRAIEGFSGGGSHGWYSALQDTDFRAAGREQM